MLRKSGEMRLLVSVGQRVVLVDDWAIALLPKEFDILRLLIVHPEYWPHF